MFYLLGVACVQLEKVFAAFGDAFDLRPARQEHCCFVVRAANDNSGDLVG